jgi:DNA-binding transcriptional LysR family regulator
MDYLSAMEAFVRSVDLGTFSKAAEETGAKVSTVSRYVSFLETDLGVALLNRSTRRLHLTEAGRTFYERATQILADIDSAKAETTSLNSSPQGLLRVNMPRAFGRRHVLPQMKEFLELYPDVKVDATLTDVTVDLIEAGADIAVRIGALVDSSLIARRLAPQRRVLVASPNYLDSRPNLQTTDDLTKHECLVFTLQPTEAWYCRPMSDGETEPTEIAVKGRFRANDSEALRDAALAGLGIALLPSWIVGSDLRDGQLRLVLPTLEWMIARGPERAIWAVYPPKKVVSPKVKAFLGFLSERFGNPPYWDSH